MTYGTLDHVFVALVALTAPLFAVWTYRRMLASLAAGDAGARSRSFRWAIGLYLVDVAVILVLFAVAGRPVEGLVRLDWLPQGWWTGAAWGVVLLACALLIAQVAAIRGNETGLATARKQMTSVEGLLPHTPGEPKLFLAAARGDRRGQRDGRLPRAETGDGGRRAAGLRARGGDGPRCSEASGNVTGASAAPDIETPRGHGVTAGWIFRILPRASSGSTRRPASIP